MGSTCKGDSLVFSACVKGKPNPEFGAKIFLDACSGCFRPGKSLSGERIPR